MSRRFLIATMFSLFAFISVGVVRAEVHSPQIEFEVVKYQMDNGLTVLIQPDRSVPLAVVQLWYRVGSKDEGGGPKGLAHLFEHMMFKGTSRFPGQFSQHVDSHGGRYNAFTTRDYTGYFVTVPQKQLEKILELEADRMVGLNMQTESVKNELNVVKEERRMRVDNSPVGIAYEGLMSAVYKGSQYEWPVIGSMNDIGSITEEHAEKFYRTHYSPNNAILVVVGDVNIEDTKAMINRQFKDLGPTKIPPLQWQEPERRKKPVNITIKRKIEAPVLMMAYPGVPEIDARQPALDLASDMLARGPSSRLYKKLVYGKKWATSVSASAMAEVHGGTLLIMVNLRSPKFMKATRRLIEQEIKSLRLSKVSIDELNKVKAQSEKDYIDALKTLLGRSRTLAFYQTIYGDYRKLFSRVADYQNVTPQSLQSALQTALNRNTLVSVEVVSP